MLFIWIFPLDSIFKLQLLITIHCFITSEIPNSNCCHSLTQIFPPWLSHILLQLKPNIPTKTWKLLGQNFSFRTNSLWVLTPMYLRYFPTDAHVYADVAKAHPASVIRLFSGPVSNSIKRKILTFVFVFFSLKWRSFSVICHNAWCYLVSCYARNVIDIPL